MHTTLSESSNNTVKDVLARHKRMKHTLRKCDKRTKHTLRKCEECDFVTCERWEADYHFLTMHPPDMWVEKSALDGKLMERTFKVEGGKCPLNVLKDYEGKIKKILKKMLESGKTVKSYIRMKIWMREKDDIDVSNIKRKKEPRKTDVWFQG